MWRPIVYLKTLKKLLLSTMCSLDYNQKTVKEFLINTTQISM